MKPYKLDKEVANQLYNDIRDVIVSMPTTEVVEAMLLIVAETTVECSGDVGPDFMSKQVIDQYLKYLELVKKREQKNR